MLVEEFMKSKTIVVNYKIINYRLSTIAQLNLLNDAHTGLDHQ